MYRATLLACLLMAVACVPRAKYRRTVQNLEQTRELVAVQQVALGHMEAEIERLEDRCGPRRPSGPPSTKATTYGVHDMRWPPLLALAHQQQAAAMAVLNAAPGPCKPCVEGGLSAASCFLEHASCANMPTLIQRVASMAGRGATQAELTEAIRYEQPWVFAEIGDAPTRGGDDAAVTIVMFMEPQCPYCVRAHSTLLELEQHYGSSLRLVYKHFPLGFHQQARPAAIAMEAARRQGRFWEYQQAVFDRARELRDNDALFTEIATELGLDLARFGRDLEDPDLAARVDADAQQAQSLGITGTPNFLVNGYPLRGAQPFAKFAALIDRELGEHAR